MAPQRPQFSRSGETISEAVQRTGLSRGTIIRYTSAPRGEYRKAQYERREKIRAYHDDEGHTWPETAEHFGTSYQNVKLLAYRARKERAAEKAAIEAAEKALEEPPLPLG